MKFFAAMIVGVVLAFGVTPALAISEADVPALQAITTDQDLSDVAQVEKYLTDKGEKYVIYTGDKKDKFGMGMAIFAGAPFPDGTGTVIVGEPDPADNLALVSIYDDKGTFIGATWVANPTIDAVKDYAEAGV